jgi:hypothetical protein
LRQQPVNSYPGAALSILLSLPMCWLRGACPAPLCSWLASSSSLTTPPLPACLPLSCPYCAPRAPLCLQLAGFKRITNYIKKVEEQEVGGGVGGGCCAGQALTRRWPAR